MGPRWPVRSATQQRAAIARVDDRVMHDVAEKRRTAQAERARGPRRPSGRTRPSSYRRATSALSAAARDDADRAVAIRPAVRTRDCRVEWWVRSWPRPPPFCSRNDAEHLPDSQASQARLGVQRTSALRLERVRVCVGRRDARARSCSRRTATNPTAHASSVMRVSVSAHHPRSGAHRHQQRQPHQEIAQAEHARPMRKLGAFLQHGFGQAPAPVRRTAPTTTLSRRTPRTGGSDANSTSVHPGQCQTCAEHQRTRQPFAARVDPPRADAAADADRKQQRAEPRHAGLRSPSPGCADCRRRAARRRRTTPRRARAVRRQQLDYGARAPSPVPTSSR